MLLSSCAKQYCRHGIIHELNKENEISLFVFTKYNEQDDNECAEAISNGSFIVKTNIGNELENEIRIKLNIQDTNINQNYDSVYIQIKNNKYKNNNELKGKFKMVIFAKGYFGTYCNRNRTKLNTIWSAIGSNGGFNNQESSFESVFNIIILEDNKIAADLISFADIDPLSKENRIYQMKELKKKLYEMSK